ncbi:Chromosome partition protein Smc [Carpediemonas membranifera]|uniref:Chromosome partition protein Smc n=1 Tax=Carpediemonas membranifera TaxID=201153 RepID=A0A8J6APT8_9EUKA|nr:Chromosome partition protein Smc [Carpediemonas membranifera]|eukprot:KAG9389953.1 Chromosome partition protein Smc [Carpediemonas membranifera]
MGGVRSVLLPQTGAQNISKRDDTSLLLTIGTEEEIYHCDSVVAANLGASYSSICHPVVENVAHGISGSIVFIGAPGASISSEISSSAAENSIVRQAAGQLIASAQDQRNAQTNCFVTLRSIAIGADFSHDLLSPDSSDLTLAESEGGAVTNTSWTKVSTDTQVTTVLDRFAVVQQLKMDSTQLKQASIVWLLGLHEESDKHSVVSQLAIVQMPEWSGSTRVHDALAECLQALSKIIGGLGSRAHGHDVPFHVPYQSSVLTTLLSKNLENLNVEVVAVFPPAAEDATRSLLSYIHNLRLGWVPVPSPTAAAYKPAASHSYSQSTRHNGPTDAQQSSTIVFTSQAIPSTPPRYQSYESPNPADQRGRVQAESRVKELQAQLYEERQNSSVVQQSVNGYKRKIAELEQALKASRATNEAYGVEVDQFDSLERENSELRSKLADAESTIVELESQLTDLSSAEVRAKEAEAALDSVRQLAAESADKTTASDKRLRQVQDEMAVLEDEVGQLRRDEGVMADRLLATKLEKDMVENKLTNAQSELVELTQRLSEKTAAENRLLAETTELKDTLADTEKQLKRITGELKELEGKHTTLSQSHRELLERVAATTTQLDQSREAGSGMNVMIAKLREDNTGLTEANKQLELNLTAEHQLRNKVTKDAEMFKSQCETMEQQIAQLVDHKDELERNIGLQKKALKDSERRVEDLESVTKRSRKHTAKLEKQGEESRVLISSLSTQVDSLKSKLTDEQNKVGDLEHELMQLNGKHQTLARQQKDSADRASRSANTVETLSARVAQQQNDLLDSASEIRRQRDTNEDLTTKLNSKEVALSNAKQRLKELEHEVETLRTERNQQTRRLAELETKAESAQAQTQGPAASKAETVYHSFAPESTFASHWAGQPDHSAVYGSQSQYRPTPYVNQAPAPRYDYGSTQPQPPARYSRCEPYHSYQPTTSASGYGGPMAQRSVYSGTAAPLSRFDLESGKTMYTGQAMTDEGQTSVNVVRTESPGRREIQLTMSEPRT